MFPLEAHHAFAFFSETYNESKGHDVSKNIWTYIQKEKQFHSFIYL